MKKIIYLFLFVAVFTACKNSEESNSENEQTTEVSEDDEMPIYRGEFIYTEGAAVLKGVDYIYAVQLDSMANVLATRVEPVKKDEYDMVPVVVQGVVAPNPALAEGKDVWKEMIAIKHIISVSKSPSQADVKIEEKN